MAVSARTLDLTQHPLGAIVPPMTDGEFRDLVVSVRTHGVQEPCLLLLDGQVLDGWHRYRAAREADARVETEDYGGDDPLGVVMRANAVRRHLTPRQRADLFVAARKALEAAGAKRRDANRPEREVGTNVPTSSDTARWHCSQCAHLNSGGLQCAECGHVPAWATQRQAEASEHQPSNETLPEIRQRQTTPSNREVAAALGVSHTTVDRAEQRLQADPAAPAAPREAPKRPSTVERLTAESEQLRQDLVVARQERDAARSKARLLEQQASPNAQARLAEWNNQRAEIRSLKAENSQARIRFEDTVRKVRATNRALQTEIRRLTGRAA